MSIFIDVEGCNMDKYRTVFYVRYRDAYSNSTYVAQDRIHHTIP
jgi:hypothetical protein